MSKQIQYRIFDAKRVQKHFSDALAFYDYWAKLAESKAATRVLELAAIQEPASVLEAGVGTGLLFERILVRNKDGFTAGIDLTPHMLAKAQKRVRKYNKEQDFDLKTGSAYHIPFPDETFDWLVSCYMLDLLPEEDFVKILKEFKRALKAGGRLVLCSMGFGHTWYHSFWAWMSRTFPDLMTDCRPVNLEPFVTDAGFDIEIAENISQNTFPSQIIKAIK